MQRLIPVTRGAARWKMLAAHYRLSFVDLFFSGDAAFCKTIGILYNIQKRSDASRPS